MSMAPVSSAQFSLTMMTAMNQCAVEASKCGDGDGDYAGLSDDECLFGYNLCMWVATYRQ